MVRLELVFTCGICKLEKRDSLEFEKMRNGQFVAIIAPPEGWLQGYLKNKDGNNEREYVCSVCLTKKNDNYFPAMWDTYLVK